MEAETEERQREKRRGLSAAALMLSETSPRSCVLPLCISHCWRPSLSGQSGVSSETSASLLECSRENSRPGQGAMDGHRPSSITAPSPVLKLKAVCPVLYLCFFFFFWSNTVFQKPFTLDGDKCSAEPPWTQVASHMEDHQVGRGGIRSSTPASVVWSFPRAPQMKK